MQAEETDKTDDDDFTIDRQLDATGDETVLKGDCACM